LARAKLAYEMLVKSKSLAGSEKSTFNGTSTGKPNIGSGQKHERAIMEDVGRATPIPERDEFDAMRSAMPDLHRLERYRRRAWSRQRRAIRRFMVSTQWRRKMPKQFLKLAYSIAELCQMAGAGRGRLYQKVKAGHLVVTKADRLQSYSINSVRNCVMIHDQLPADTRSASRTFQTVWHAALKSDRYAPGRRLILVLRAAIRRNPNNKSICSGPGRLAGIALLKVLEWEMRQRKTALLETYGAATTGWDND
jgi:hypothetical protein